PPIAPVSVGLSGSPWGRLEGRCSIEPLMLGCPSHDLDPLTPTPSPTLLGAHTYVPAAGREEFVAACRDHDPLAVERTADAEKLNAVRIAPHTWSPPPV